MLRIIIVAIAAGFSLASPAYATLAPIVVQPFVLCSGTTSDTCTDANVNFSALFDASLVNQIYAQTATINADETRNDDAINFSIRAANYITNSQFTTVTVDPVANSFDSGHVLLRSSNSFTANESPNTINVYLVNDIASGDVKTYGFGLISSNGILIASDARVDTLAHELGHNLGLPHYADPGNDPSNTAVDLMAPGDVRTVPDGTGDPAIASSIDLLTPAQDAVVHQPLFTIDGASAALGADAGFPNAPVCKAGLIACTLFIVSNASDSGQALDSVDIRWTDPNFLDGVLLDPLLHGFLGNIGATCNREDFKTSKISDTSKNLVGSELIVTFDPGCLLPGRVSQIAFSRQADNWTYEVPLSVQFNFDNGNTSLGGLDASGGFLGAPNTFNAVDTSSFADETFSEGVPVPEPGSQALLLAALLLLAGRAGLQPKIRTR